MPRLTKAEKEAAAAAVATGDGDTPAPAPTPPAAPRSRSKAKSTGGELTGHPLDVMIGVGAEATTIDGVDYVVDPETGRITGTA